MHLRKLQVTINRGGKDTKRKENLLAFCFISLNVKVERALKKKKLIAAIKG
jgi:hypothetical protein